MTRTPDTLRRLYDSAQITPAVAAVVCGVFSRAWSAYLTGRR